MPKVKPGRDIRHTAITDEQLTRLVAEGHRRSADWKERRMELERAYKAGHEAIKAEMEAWLDEQHEFVK